MQKKYINIALIGLSCLLIVLRVFNFKLIADIVSGILLILLILVSSENLKTHFGEVATIMAPTIILFIVWIVMGIFNASESIQDTTQILILASLAGSLLYGFYSVRVKRRENKEN